MGPRVPGGWRAAAAAGALAAWAAVLLARRRPSGAIIAGCAAPPSERVFTKAELAARYNSSQRVYLAICGHVYDVSAGLEYYGAGRGYAFFAGRDGSLAYVTGRFGEDLTDDVSSLTAPQRADLAGWRAGTYDAKYDRVGVLEGFFFDRCGGPTPEGARFEADVAAEAERKRALDADAAAHPTCNSRRRKAEHKVWCADHLRPRRRLFLQAERCACAAPGDADGFEPYPGCDPDAASCDRLTPAEP